jgi:hypothetical protein
MPAEGDPGMHQGQIVFSQLMEFVPQHAFRKCINRYQGNYRMRSFSCYDQFLCMAFAQLTFRESLHYSGKIYKCMNKRCGFKRKISQLFTIVTYIPIT